MPTYAKMPIGTQDYSSGVQSVNQLRDNFASDLDGANAEHGSAFPGFVFGQATPPSTKAFGHHNTPKIPRAVVRTSIAASGFATVTVGAIEAQPVVTSVVRLGVGVYFITLAELLDFYAVVEVTQTTSAQRLVYPRSSFGGAGTPVGIAIEVYERAGAGAGFDLIDVDWCATIYGSTS